MSRIRMSYSWFPALYLTSALLWGWKLESSWLTFPGSTSFIPMRYWSKKILETVLPWETEIWEFEMLSRSSSWYFKYSAKFAIDSKSWPLMITFSVWLPIPSILSKELLPSIPPPPLLPLKFSLLSLASKLIWLILTVSANRSTSVFSWMRDFLFIFW